MKLQGNRVLGMSIEQSGVRYVRLKSRKSGEIAQSGTLALPLGMMTDNEIKDREGLLEQLQQWVQTEGIRGSQVLLSIPPSQMIIRKMSIPSVNRKQVEQLVRLEVETGLHLPFDNAVYDYVITGMREELQHTEVLVFAAPRALIDRYVELLSAAGLKVQNIEISATALARAAVLSAGVTLGDTMLIHLEGNMLDVYLFQGGQPLFLRNIPLGRSAPQGGGQLPWDNEVAASSAMPLQQEADGLKAGQLSEVLQELSRMLNFYQYSLHDGTVSIHDVVLTGPEAGRTLLSDGLTEMLPDLQIESVSFAQGPLSSVQNGGQYRIAWGAAMHGQGVNTLSLIQREDRESRKFAYLVLSLATIVVIALAGMGTVMLITKGSGSTLSEQIQGVRDQNQALVAELKKLSVGGEAASHPEMIVEELKQQRLDAVQVLDELDRKLPTGSVIRNIAYNQFGDLLLSVDMVKLEDAALYLGALQKAAFAREVSLSKISHLRGPASPTGAPSGVATFSVKAPYNGLFKINTSRASAASAKEVK